jgi:hypothetical protein
MATPSEARYLALHGTLDFRAVERRAFLDDVGPEVTSHVEHDPTRCDGGHVLDAELRQAVGHGEITSPVAVEVEVVDADMTEAIDLRTDAVPARDDVVVVASPGPSERGSAGLARLDDRELEPARRVGRRVFVRLDAEVRSSLLCPRWRHIVQRP